MTTNKTTPLTYEALVSSKGFIVQGLNTDVQGYMVPLKGYEVTLIQQNFNSQLTYSVYRAYYEKMVWLLRRYRNYYLTIANDQNLIYFDIYEYEEEQDIALALTKARDFDFIYSLHGQENIYIKQIGH